MRRLGLDRSRLEDICGSLEFVNDLHVLDGVASTNDEVRELARDGAAEGCVVVADHQTSGRGRQGKSWYSPRGLGLYVSLLIRDLGPVDHATRWTLGLAVAACEACNDLTGCRATIKWPNDVEAGGKKLAGILAELRGGAERELVLGCGINCGHRDEDFPRDVAHLATSLARETGTPGIDREALCGRLLQRFDGIRKLLQKGDWAPVAERWLALAPGGTDQRVRVLRKAGDFLGVTRGIDESGGLVVQSDQGETTVVRLVDSVRPVHDRASDEERDGCC